MFEDGKGGSGRGEPEIQQAILPLDEETRRMVSSTMNRKPMMPDSLRAGMRSAAIMTITASEETSILKRKNQELLDEIARLKDQNEYFRQEFSYVEKTIQQICHDLSTQIIGGFYVLGTLEAIGEGNSLALESAESHEGQIYAKKAKNGLSLAIDILKSFRKRMAIVKGDFELKENDFDLMEALELIKSALWQPTCELEISLKKLDSDSSTKDGLEIKGDREILLAALFNLIKNAMEAAQSSKATNKTVMLQINEGLESISITIENPGAIPEEIQSRILKESVTHGKPNGNGLGMLIAKSFIEALGGKLSIESKENTTTATIELPKNPTAALEKEKIEAEETANHAG